MNLQMIPLSIKDANLFVQNFHRHNKPVHGAKFAVGASYKDALVGVAIVGRPVARRLDDGFTAEAVRVCVNDKAPKNTRDFYRSQAELVEAMSDKRYDKDPAYRQDVIAKLERSNNLQF